MKGKYIKAGSTSTPTGWVRPSDWLPIPSIAPGEEVFYGLFAVYNLVGNYVAFSFAGNYTVDWGDGSALENVSSGVKAEHQYDWSNVGNVTSEGWRQALIKVTPQAGQNLTNINVQQAHTTTGTGKASQFRDMVMSLPNVSGNNQVIGNSGNVIHSNCQRVWIKNIGAITIGTQMFLNFRSLQSVPLFNTSSITVMNNMFQTCNALETVPLFDTSSCINMGGMFANCLSLETVPLFNTALVTTMASMFQGCQNLKEVPLFNTSSVNNMSTMFNTCITLKTVPLFDMSAVTTTVGMFLSCLSLETVPDFNTPLVTNVTNMFNACACLYEVELNNMSAVTTTTTMFGGTTASLQKFTATGLTRGISVANQLMSATELNNFFTSLGIASGAQTITVTGNYGAATCNTAIATGKGFTVVT